MLARVGAALLSLLFLPHGCFSDAAHQPVHLLHKAVGGKPQLLALYEPWFGHPRHIQISYNSHDANVLRKQVQKAKSMGISGFVVDWYGNRDAFNDQTYALMQTTAAKQNFKVAMLYDETDKEDSATDVALADFAMFRSTYLAADAAGREAYLTYEGRPVIFIFPKGNHTNWDRVRAELNKWNPAPILIQENEPGKFPGAFDGYYAWISPGKQGWAADGSNWGEEYLDHFYSTMTSKYQDKIHVGGIWASFDDSKASWGLNRNMAANCGQTFKNTSEIWRKYYAPDDPPPFLMIETWNDYEEGSAIEPGIPACKPGTTEPIVHSGKLP